MRTPLKLSAYVLGLADVFTAAAGTPAAAGTTEPGPDGATESAPDTSSPSSSGHGGPGHTHG